MAKSKRGRRTLPDRGKPFVRQVIQEGWEDEFSDAIDLLWTLLEKADDPGRALAELAAYDADRGIAEAATTLLMVTLGDPDIQEAEARRVAETALPVLDRALHDPELPDERKYMLGPAYVRLGGALSVEEMQACFRDFEGIQKRKLKELLAEVSDQPASVDQVLSTFDLATDDEAPEDEQELFGPMFMLCSDLATGDPAAAAAVLSGVVAMAAEWGLAGEGARAALGMIAEQRCPRAAWCLDELGRWPGLGELGAEARFLAAELIEAGIEPRATVLCDFSHGMLTCVDGSGSRAMHLFFRTPEGGMDAVSVMVNDEVGMKDMWYVPEEGAEVDRSFRDLPAEISYAPCSVELAREVLADAWALHEELDEPMPARLLVCLPYLGSEPILPHRRTPNLGAYMLELLQRTPDLFRGSEHLVEVPMYGGLFFASDAAYAFCQEHRPRRGPQRLSKNNLARFIREAAIQEREALLRRMAVNLEVESLAGRATQRINRVAARTWLGLTEEVVPFHDVPFIQALAADSAEMIIENLRMGFLTQADANAAGLAMDELDGLSDDEDEDEDDEEDGFFFDGPF